MSRFPSSSPKSIQVSNIPFHGHGHLCSKVAVSARKNSSNSSIILMCAKPPHLPSGFSCSPDKSSASHSSLLHCFRLPFPFSTSTITIFKTDSILLKTHSIRLRHRSRHRRPKRGRHVRNGPIPNRPLPQTGEQRILLPPRPLRHDCQKEESGPIRPQLTARRTHSSPLSNPERSTRPNSTSTSLESHTACPSTPRHVPPHRAPDLLLRLLRLHTPEFRNPRPRQMDRQIPKQTASEISQESRQGIRQEIRRGQRSAQGRENRPGKGREREKGKEREMRKLERKQAKINAKAGGLVASESAGGGEGGDGAGDGDKRGKESAKKRAKDEKAAEKFLFVIVAQLDEEVRARLRKQTGK